MYSHTATHTHTVSHICTLQEVLLMLDEYWEQHPELQGVPIYQVSGCDGA